MADKDHREPSEKSSMFSFESIRSFWSERVAFEFFSEESALADHYANERTWHNWLAVSNAVSWMGIVVAQMSKIARVVRPEHYHMLRYKACICQVVAIIVLLIGSYRFFCEQNAISEVGKRASPWSLLATGVLILLLSCSFFIMLAIANTDILED